MPYHERHYALTGIMSNTSRVKSPLKTKVELFQGDNKEHFGKEFWEQIFEIVMVHKNSIELLTSTLSQNRFRGGMTFFFQSQNQNKPWHTFSSRSNSSHKYRG